MYGHGGRDRNLESSAELHLLLLIEVVRRSSLFSQYICFLSLHSFALLAFSAVVCSWANNTVPELMGLQFTYALGTDKQP